MAALYKPVPSLAQPLLTRCWLELQIWGHEATPRWDDMKTSAGTKFRLIWFSQGSHHHPSNLPPNQVMDFSASSQPASTLPAAGATCPEWGAASSWFLQPIMGNRKSRGKTNQRSDYGQGWQHQPLVQSEAHQSGSGVEWGGRRGQASTCLYLL